MGEKEYIDAEVRFVDIASTEMLSYPEVYSDIMDNSKAMPYITLNGELLTSGISSPQKICDMIEASLNLQKG